MEITSSFLLYYDGIITKASAP